MRSAGHRPALLHAANSGATILYPETHLDLVRTGIAIYGLEPAPGVADGLGLRPALTWRSKVGSTKRLPAGERVSYGHRYQLERDANVATVPVGYADGYPRMLSSRADVLIRGHRCRVAGSVTMDQLIVDCGDVPVEPGDDVVLIGRQGDQSVTAEELAGLAGTIGYEIVTGIGVAGAAGARGMSTKRTAAIATAVAAGTLAAGAVARVVVGRHHRASDGASSIGDLPPEELDPVVSFDGTQIAVRVAGEPDAPLLLFTHGFSLDMSVWHEQWIDLADDFRCVLMDHRSHGASAGAAHGDLSIRAMGRDIAAVLDAVAPDRPAVVVGHSMGAMAIIAMAEQRPELFGPRVTGAVLIGASSSDLFRGAMGSVAGLLRSAIGRVRDRGSPSGPPPPRGPRRSRRRREGSSRG